MILLKVFDENNVQEFFPLQLFIALDLIWHKKLSLNTYYVFDLQRLNVNIVITN